MQSNASMATQGKESIAGMPLTMPVTEAGRYMGLGRSTTYELVKRGEFPVRVLELGRRKRVSRADLLAYLGETPKDAA